MAAKRMTPPPATQSGALMKKAKAAGMSNAEYARANAGDGDSRDYLTTLKKIAPGKRR